jgi:hypothetical protein
MNTHHLLQIAEWLIQEGTQRDDNAFDKDYLPKIKDIIFKLLDNKGEEKSDMFDF